MQNPMNGIHREHKKFGYITSVAYAATVDSENKADWLISYVPGPKARAEYHTFTRSGRVIELTETPEEESGAVFPKQLAAPRRRTTRQKHLRFDQSLDLQPEATEGRELAPAPLIGEMVRRGISQAKAQALLGTANAETLPDQLEWGDEQIRLARPGGEIRNPAGFYIHLIEQKVLPPPGFETSRIRRSREEHRAKLALEQAEALRLEREYDEYRAREIDRYMSEQVSAEELKQLTHAELLETRKKYPGLPKQTIESMIPLSIRFNIGQRLRLLTFEAFCDRERRQPPSPIIAEA